MGKRNLQVSKPVFLGREKIYLHDCIEREELSWHGRYVGQFEQSFAKFVGVKHVAATCNGTAALHLALLAAGVGPGWGVFVPALSYVATANAVTYCGATPIFCDINKDTWNIDPDDLEEQMPIKRLGRVAILPVHLYGVPADMSKIMQLAQEHGAPVIEDAAEAHGATYHGQMVGSFGLANAFSFYANKILTTGEGGAVTTNDSDIDLKIRLLRGQGTVVGSYNHTVLGYNYRMTNMHAAIGLAQVECAKYHVHARQRCCAWYRAALGGRYTIQQVPDGCVSADWMMTVLVPKASQREEIRRKLALVGIETRATFPALTDLPMYDQDTPTVTAAVSARGINLPTHGELREEDVAFVVSEFDKAVGA